MNIKNILIFVVLIIIVLGIILLINYVRANGNHDEEVMKCIAENSKLFVSKTCGHCAAQKQDLGEYLDLFEIIDCTTDIQNCRENNILYVPTWVINNENHAERKSVEQLKQLTGC